MFQGHFQYYRSTRALANVPISCSWRPGVRASALRDPTRRDSVLAPCRRADISQHRVAREWQKATTARDLTRPCTAYRQECSADVSTRRDGARVPEPASRVEFYSTGTLAGADMADARSVGSRVGSIPCTCRICALVSIVRHGRVGRVRSPRVMVRRTPRVASRRSFRFDRDQHGSV